MFRRQRVHINSLLGVYFFFFSKEARLNSLAVWLHEEKTAAFRLVKDVEGSSLGCLRGTSWVDYFTRSLLLAGSNVWA
jgi:hypothetical protein